MPGFFVSQLMHCYWPSAVPNPVIAFLPDGEKVEIPYEVAKAILRGADEPRNKYDGWDLKLQPDQAPGPSSVLGVE